MLWTVSTLVKHVGCPGSFLYLNGQLFFEIWEIFCFYFLEYITYPFDLQLFCFLDAHNSCLGFWWSSWVLVYSFYSFLVSCLRVLLFFFNIYFVFKSQDSVFHLFQSAGVAFPCIF
jgi:hypothetical protein